MDVASVRSTAPEATGSPKPETKTRKQTFEEALTKVTGHSYWEVTSGPKKGAFVNASGNARDGQYFDRVERDGRAFHVYGSGTDRVVVEVKADKPLHGGTAAKT